MNAIIREIMGAPEDERLDYALDFIRTLTCDAHDDVAHYQTMGLSPQQACIVNYLARRPGMVCSREQLMMVMYDVNSDVSEKIVDVHISKIRKKLPEGTIENVWGRGWKISPEHAAALVPPPRVEPEAHRTAEQPVPDRVRAQLPEHNKKWTEDDDEELLRMHANGAEWWAIADELSRTERGCQERYRKLTRQTA